MAFVFFVLSLRGLRVKLLEFDEHFGCFFGKKLEIVGFTIVGGKDSWKVLV